MFFTSISQMMTESVDLTLVIRKANGQLTVSTLPKANGLKDEAANHIIPLTLTGTPEEMDAEFLQHIMQRYGAYLQFDGVREAGRQGCCQQQGGKGCQGQGDQGGEGEA